MDRPPRDRGPGVLPPLDEGRHEVQLSDLRPNRDDAARQEGTPGIEYRMDPLSVLEVPAAEDGVRTMFTSLHHVDREGVRAILRGAQAARVPFVGAEATHRSLRGVS